MTHIRLVAGIGAASLAISACSAQDAARNTTLPATRQPPAVSTTDQSTPSVAEPTTDVTPPDRMPIGVAEQPPADGSIGRTSWIPRVSSLSYPAPDVQLNGPTRSVSLDAAPLPPGPLVTPDGQGVIVTFDPEEVAEILDPLATPPRKRRLVVASPDGSVSSLPLNPHGELVAVAPGAVLVSLPSELVAMRVPSGEFLWRAPHSGGVSPPPAFHRGIAYSIRDRKLSATSLDAGQLLWSVEVTSRETLLPLAKACSLSVSRID